jgi:beta-lactamase class D
MSSRRSTIVLLALIALQTAAATQTNNDSVPARTSSCFLLSEIGGRELRRNPADACAMRLTPASTFKVPHALAALDARVITTDERLLYDGTGQWPSSARRDHTLASAVPDSVVWFFQRLAERLGPEREAGYLRRLRFGNMDSSSGLTTFWLAGSLQITAEEQRDFWIRLYTNKLPIAADAVSTVKRLIVEPPGAIVNAAGEQPFAAPWPEGAIVSAKPGSFNESSGRSVRWLVGHIVRSAGPATDAPRTGRPGGREYVFVSCVVGGNTLAPNAAIDLAGQSLKEAGVL